MNDQDCPLAPLRLRAEEYRMQEALRESEERFRLLFQSMVSGFALHEIICDTAGRPVDYRFLEINPAFEKLTGLKPTDLIGRTVREALPGTEDLWIEKYGDVALGGGPVHFENYSAALDRHFEVSAYSPKPGQFATIFLDISARKEAEAALRESEEKYRSLAENSHDYIMRYDRRHRHVFANAATLSVSGMCADEFIGKTHREIGFPDHLCDLWEIAIEQVFITGEPHREVFQWTGAQGPVVLDWRLIPERNVRGDVASVLGVSRDITAQKRAEEALRESETRYRRLFDSINDAVFVHEIDEGGMPGRFLQINATACRRLGYSREELLALSPRDISPPAEVARLAEKRLALTADGQAVFETLHVARDGRRIPVESNVRLFDHEGRRAALSISRDISERKKAEEELRILAAAVHQANEGIVVVAPEGKIEYVNPAFERITGFRDGEALGTTPRILKSGRTDDAFYRTLWQTIASGESWSGRIVNRRKDGTLFTAESSIAPVKSETGSVEHYVWVTRDISRDLDREEQLRQTQRLEAVGHLAAGMAHDLNNLLTPILGYTEMMLDELDPAGDLHPRVLQIKNAADRARDLIRQLLAFGRKQMLEMRTLDLRQAVREMENLIRRTIREDIALDFAIGPQPCPVNADVGQVGQVLMNLVVNAQDAMPTGGTLTVRVAPASLEDSRDLAHLDLPPGRYALLAISDTGCGMESDIQRQIFEPFFTTKKHNGTGLGLATVYGIVKQHGGGVHVESIPGRGTAFTIYLPMAATDAAETDEIPTRIQGMRGGSETILVAEDNSQVRDLACSILEKLGYTVLEAASGRAALALLARHDGPLHLLLTDVVMPDMNGRELAGRIGLRHPGIKILFMSGYSENVIGHHGVLDREVQFIQKPFAVKTLAAKVRETIEGD